MKQARYVVAVAAPVGGGKTSLANALASALGDATTVAFDHYETATQMPVRDLLQWISQGARFDAFEAPHLAIDLKHLKKGRSIIDPATHAPIKPAKYIVLETPLGREHGETAALIDLLLWIETPLDIALARKLKQFTGAFLAQADTRGQRQFVDWLDTYLAGYLEAVGRVLAIQKERVGAGADIILDGLMQIPEMVGHAVRQIRQRLA